MRIFCIFAVFAAAVYADWRMPTDTRTTSIVRDWVKFYKNIGIHKLDVPSTLVKWPAVKSFSGLISSSGKRFKNFKKTYLRVVANNKKFKKGLSTFRMELNEFADLSKDELSMFLGAAEDTTADVDGEAAAEGTVESVANFADESDALDEVDWRVPGVLNARKQKMCGSCWAFAAISMIQNRLYHHSGWTEQLAPQELIDCSDAGDCSGGLPKTALNYIAENGITSEGELAYQAEDGTCSDPQTVRSILPGAITPMNQDNSGLAGTEAEMKALVSEGAITVGMFVLSDFVSYKDGVYSASGCNSTHEDFQAGHVVTIVGYTEDAWIVQNSWGTNWGDDGFGYIARGSNTCGIGKYFLRWSFTYVNLDNWDSVMGSSATGRRLLRAEIANLTEVALRSKPSLS